MAKDSIFGDNGELGCAWKTDEARWAAGDILGRGMAAAGNYRGFQDKAWGVDG